MLNIELGRKGDGDIKFTKYLDYDDPTEKARHIRPSLAMGRG